MRVNVLHNTHVNLKDNKIHNLINKVISIVIIRPVIIVTIWNVNIYIYVHIYSSKIKYKIRIS
jgi:hypothetical protein